MRSIVDAMAPRWGSWWADTPIRPYIIGGIIGGEMCRGPRTYRGADYGLQNGDTISNAITSGRNDDRNLD